MKTLIIFNCICILFHISQILGCSPSKDSKSADTYVMIYYDVTENINDESINEFETDLEKVFAFMNIHENDNSNGFGKIQFSLLNSEYFEKPSVLEYVEDDLPNNNPYYKIRYSKEFIQNSRRILKELFSREVTKLDTLQSIIIRHIVEAIEILNNSNFHRKVLIVYSDMLEHNPSMGISFIDSPPDTSNLEKTINLVKQVYRLDLDKFNRNDNIMIYIIRPDHEKYPLQRIKTEIFWKKIFHPYKCYIRPILDFSEYETSSTK